MAEPIARGIANQEDTNRVRYSVSLVKQGKQQFYTLTMPSEVLASTCFVSTRKESPIQGFQRTLDEKRALEIARYIDEGLGTIPNSIVLSAQEDAQLKIVGRGKTVEFTRSPNAFLILDGQHRVFGFSKAKTSLRVPVVIYNGLTRREETRLFIDINTKQRPVPSQLLLDIKNLADIESEAEEYLRSVFDQFNNNPTSAMYGQLSPSEASRSKITRVTFNHSLKPLLQILANRSPEEAFSILNAFLSAANAEISKRTNQPVLTKPVVFRGLLGVFRPVAQRVQDKFDSEYTVENFQQIMLPIFQNMPISKLERPGGSWTEVTKYLDNRLNAKTML